MSSLQWSVYIAPAVTRDKYKIPRGEAALFRDAVATLYAGVPADAKPIPDTSNTYVYSRNGYLIAFEVHTERRALRVIYFERE